MAARFVSVGSYTVALGCRSVRTLVFEGKPSEHRARDVVIQISAFIECRGVDDDPDDAGHRVHVYFLRPESDLPEPYYAEEARAATIYVPEAHYPWYRDLLRHEQEVYASLFSDKPFRNCLCTGSDVIGLGDTSIR